MAAVSTQPFSLHLFDVGQGEALVIDLPDGDFGLIDAGPSKCPKAILAGIESRVRSGRRFRFAAATQWDQDHIAGMPAVVRRFKPDEILLPGLDVQILEELSAIKEFAPNRQLARDLHEAWRDIPKQRLWAGDLLTQFGKDVIAVALSPNWQVEEDLREALYQNPSASSIKQWRNRASLVLWLEVYGRTLFLGGEAESDQFREMEAHFRHPRRPIYRKAPAADWIKLSHHGSHKDNPLELFQHFAKRRFVASASAGGKYGHPHPVPLSLVVRQKGRAMCTGLGQACSTIIKKGLDASRPEQWLAKYPPASQPNPGSPCYGTITVEINKDGRLSLRSTHFRENCPYGGPRGQLLRL